MAFVKELKKGLWEELPPFRLLLGLCPTLAVTNSASNGLGMGVCVIFVLTLSNVLVSMCRNFIPKTVRIACFIVIAASLVVALELLMQAYTYPLYESLGIFVPLIVVNCIILGRAEAFANKNTPGDSALDGIGIGLGFTIALTVIGLVRELLGSLSLFGFKLAEGDGILAFVLAPGAFLVLGYLMVIFRKLTSKKA